MNPEKLTSDQAFREAGSTCTITATGHKAKTMYVVVTDDYLFPSCGDHLTRVIREASSQYSPPVEKVVVYWRP